MQENNFILGVRPKNYVIGTQLNVKLIINLNTVFKFAKNTRLKLQNIFILQIKLYRHFYY